MSAKAGGIPGYRPFDGPALLRQGFRPFLLGAGHLGAGRDRALDRRAGGDRPPLGGPVGMLV
jgi:hypothetical protein